MWKKIIIALVLFLLLIAIGIRIGVPYYAGKQIGKLLTEADSASYSYLDIDMWAGDIIINDIYLSDTNGNIARQPVFLQLDAINISGANIWRAYRKKILTIDEVHLGRGFIDLALAPGDSAQTNHKRGKTAALHQIELQKVRIDSLGFHIGLNEKNEQEAYSGILHFHSDSVHIPLSKTASVSHVNTQLHVDHIYAQPHKSVAYFTVDSLRFSSNTKEIALHQIKMNQRIDQTRYASYFGFDKDYVTLEIYRVNLNGIPQSLREFKEGIHLPKVTVLGPQAYIYKDRRLPHPSNEKKFIVEGLSDIDLPIRIDTIQVVDGQLFFNENWRDDYVPGQIFLSDLQIAMYNLNNTGPTEVGNWTVIDANITMYNRLQLGVDWEFDLRTKGRAFVLDIDIGSTSFSTLNPFTENTAGARFRDGYLHGGRLYVEADKTSGAGSLDLYYSDLKIKFLDKKTHHTNVVKWAEGGLANLAVRNKNLPDKKPRQGVIYAEPLLDRAIFGYVMRMFFSGFKDIALTSKNEDKVAERGMNYIDMPAAAKKKRDKNKGD
jgi:hypothetical protein